MKILLVILGYLAWHYSKAIRSISAIWKNFLDFIFDFFSIHLLFKNFFDPWKRLGDDYPKHFDLKKYFYAFLTNLIVRLVGILLRFVLIITGLICYIAWIFLYPLLILIWLILPFLALGLLVQGIRLLFNI